MAWRRMDPLTMRNCFEILHNIHVYHGNYVRGYDYSKTLTSDELGILLFDHGICIEIALRVLMGSHQQNCKRLLEDTKDFIWSNRNKICMRDHWKYCFRMEPKTFILLSKLMFNLDFWEWKNRWNEIQWFCAKTIFPRVSNTIFPTN